MKYSNVLVSDGRRLPTNRRQQVFPNGTLFIEQVQRHEDEGNYVCSARAADSPSVDGSLKITVKGWYFKMKYLCKYDSKNLSNEYPYFYIFYYS